MVYSSSNIAMHIPLTSLGTGGYQQQQRHLTENDVSDGASIEVMAGSKTRQMTTIEKNCRAMSWSGNGCDENEPLSEVYVYTYRHIYIYTALLNITEVRVTFTPSCS